MIGSIVEFDVSERSVQSSRDLKYGSERDSMRMLRPGCFAHDQVKRQIVSSRIEVGETMICELSFDKE